MPHLLPPVLFLDIVTFVMLEPILRNHYNITGSLTAACVRKYQPTVNFRLY